MKLRFLDLANGGAGELSGKFLVSYDPNYHPPTNLNTYDGGKVETTYDKEKALDLPLDKLIEVWKASPDCFCHCRRIDGLPNKPLTAYNIEINQ